MTVSIILLNDKFEKIENMFFIQSEKVKILRNH